MDSPNEPAYVSIKRINQYFGYVRGLQIYLDSEHLGALSSGATERYKVAPGMHTFHCKMDWCSSPPLKIEVGPGQEERLRCGSIIQGWNNIIAMYYIVFQASECMLMEQT